MHRPLRLTIDRSAIQSNWRWLAERAGVPAGAAVKADGYGLGAREVAEALIEAGCRDLFVSTWAEAEALGKLPAAVSLVVLHGVGPNDLEAAALRRAPLGLVLQRRNVPAVLHAEPARCRRGSARVPLLRSLVLHPGSQQAAASAAGEVTPVK